MVVASDESMSLDADLPIVDKFCAIMRVFIIGDYERVHNIPESCKNSSFDLLSSYTEIFI